MEQALNYSEDGSQPIDKDSDEYRIAVLSALAGGLAIKRREAVTAKTTTGIEIEWLGDTEFYEGYDDANRHEFVNTVTKPMVGGATQDDSPTNKPAGSTVFPNITQPYVDAAAARVGDMLLPTDDRNFAIEATPIPDMFEDLERMLAAGRPNPVPAAAPVDTAVSQAASMGVAGMPGAPMPVQPPQPQEEATVMLEDGVVVSLAEAKSRFDKMKAEAARKAEKAQTQIDDWLDECQYHAEMRKVIDDAAKLGSGVVKGPVPVKRVSREWRRDEATGAYQLITVEEIKPASKRVDPWDLFPDPACGESIHNGSHIWERDRLTAKKLEDLIGTPGYIESEIRQCLIEKPKSPVEADSRNLVVNRYTSRDQFEIWYFHGTITVGELRAAGVEDLPEGDDEKSIPAMITMVNDRVIRASLNPLDDGQFPYDVIPWKRRPGIPWGMGVARQMRTPQRIVVAATRNLMDNAGMAAGPQIIIRRGVQPQNNVWEIVPLKIWVEEDDAGTGQVTAPVTSVTIPMLQAELMAIIQFGMKMAEDVTGLPMLLQGQQGTAPDTVGGLTILNNNANSVLRRIARLFDSSITEPHIRRYYAWLMCYGDDDDAKGDFQIIARGSSALVERDIQSQELVQIVQLCLNPAFKKDPAKAMDEYLKSRRFDPKTFNYTEQELEEIKNQPQPEDPRIAAAKIMVEGRLKQDEQKFGAEQQKQQSEQAFKAGQAEQDRAFQQAMAELMAELDQQAEQGKREMSMGDIKTRLTETVMKLNTQKQLAMQAANAVPQVASPATEPPARARDGMAFQE